MLNEVRQDRSGNARFYHCPSTVVAGDLVLLGTLAIVAVDDYNSVTGGTTFRFSGTFDFLVYAATVVSPLTGSALKPGDKVYGAGTYDSTTNMTTDLTLSKATGGTLVGTYDEIDDLTSGTSASVGVKLKETP